MALCGQTPQPCRFVDSALCPCCADTKEDDRCLLARAVYNFKEGGGIPPLFFG